MGTQEHYVMEENDGELERLENQHVVLKSSMGTLLCAPIEFVAPCLRILDSGTADGLWLRDLQASVRGQHQYIGTDIVAAYFPEPAPSNIAFHAQSITQDWPQSWKATFDYVHQRLTLVGAGREPVVDCVRRLVQLLRPGGWIELVEAIFTEDSSNGPAMRQFEAMMRQLLDAVGVGFHYGRSLQAHLKHCGVENLHERVFKISYGAACEDPDVARRSISHLLSASRGLWDFTHGLQSATTAQSESNDRVSFLCAVRRELEDQGAFFDMVAVWGQAGTAAGTM